MFNFDSSTVFLCFLVSPLIGLLSLEYLLGSGDTRLPRSTWLLRLPGYRYLYARKAGAGALRQRGVIATGTWLACLYSSILVFIAPFVNKLLGMAVWLSSVPTDQAALILLYDLCLIVIGYSLFAVVTRLARGFLTGYSRSAFPFLALAALDFAFGTAVTFAMSADIRLAVLLASKTLLTGLFGFLFFGSLLSVLNLKELKTGAGLVGGSVVNFFLMLLAIGSLVSVVA